MVALPVSRLPAKAERLLILGQQIRPTARARALACHALRLRLGLRLEPRDLWLGLYADTARRRLYICVVPCVALVLELAPRRLELTAERRALLDGLERLGLELGDRRRHERRIHHEPVHVGRRQAGERRRMPLGRRASDAHHLGIPAPASGRELALEALHLSDALLELSRHSHRSTPRRGGILPLEPREPAHRREGTGTDTKPVPTGERASFPRDLTIPRERNRTLGQHTSPEPRPGDDQAHEDNRMTDTAVSGRAQPSGAPPCTCRIRRPGAAITSPRACPAHRHAFGAI